MKRITIILLALLALNFTNAQDYYTDENITLKKNEVKLNLASSIFWYLPEVSYERILDEDISLGSTFGASLANNTDYKNIKFEVSPYFRWFFGGNRKATQKYATGFFIEANTGILLLEYNEYLNHEDKWRFSAGVALGWKYASKNNWVGEIYLGAGRIFRENNEESYPRLGISIGKRF